MRLLEDIRATETPGKRGGEFFYAQMIYGYFDEIEKLKGEGFTLTTICKFLEKKGALPEKSDPRSFRRAFRREAARRQRAISKEVKVNDTAKKEVKGGENIPRRDVSEAGVKQKPEIPFTPAKSKSSRGRLQINPDNTFNITPIDPDDLPDIN